MGTPEFLSMMRLRKIWAEGSFSVLKREHCISKIRKRGILAATEECLLAAMALNLKRMAKCHLSLSPNLLFCWGHDGFQLNFYVCQQVQILTEPIFQMSESTFTLPSVYVADFDSGLFCTSGKFDRISLFNFFIFDSFLSDTLYSTASSHSPIRFREKYSYEVPSPPIME